MSAFESYSSESTKPPTKEEEVLSTAIIKVTSKLGLTQKELSEIIGASKSEISRLFHGKSFISPNTKEGECALMLIRLYESLYRLFGKNEKQYQEWFKSYHYDFSAKPIEKVKNIEGLVQIVYYLEAVRGLA